MAVRRIESKLVLNGFASGCGAESLQELFLALFVSILLICDCLGKMDFLVWGPLNCSV